MNCWACAPGAENTAATATAAAMSFEFMSSVPPKFRREIGRTGDPGQPVQRAHATTKYAGLGHRRGCSREPDPDTLVE
jgi:hypothetical protein